MLGTYEENDGLFVAVTDEDVEYSHLFIKACAECEIPTKGLTRGEAMRLESNSSPELVMAVQIRDATIYAMHTALLRLGQTQWRRD